MEEILVRGWENFLARPSGPLDIRFIVQPLVATILAVRAGIRDARTGQPPFLWTLLTSRTRKSLAVHASKDIGKVFVLALVLDAIYQVITVHGIYFLEMLFTATVLAILPYSLIRGPANRAARWLMGTKVKRNGNAASVT